MGYKYNPFTSQLDYFETGSSSDGFVLKDVWNATGNDPNLVNGVGTVGDTYIVGTGGTINLNPVTNDLSGIISEGTINNQTAITFSVLNPSIEDSALFISFGDSYGIFFQGQNLGGAGGIAIQNDNDGYGLKIIYDLDNNPHYTLGDLQTALNAWSQSTLSTPQDIMTLDVGDAGIAPGYDIQDSFDVILANGQTGQAVTYYKGDIIYYYGDQYVKIGKTTNDVPEGNSNLYFTEARAKVPALGEYGIVETSVFGDQTQTNTAIQEFLIPQGAGAFEAIIYVQILADTPKYEVLKLIGVYNGSSWTMTQIHNVGDDSDVSFSIDGSGQVSYSSGTYAGFAQLTIKFKVSALAF